MTNLNEDAHIAAIRWLYEVVLNQNRVELLADLLADNVIYHGTQDSEGVDPYRRLIDMLRVAFPDQHFTLHDLIANDDRVAVRWTMEATHAGVLAGIPATRKRVQQRANVIYRFEEGKIAEVWSQMDQMGMLRQLGQTTLPAPQGAGFR